MRLGYLDWARGLAVLVMIHIHAFNAWVIADDRTTPWFQFSRLIGGYPAVLFLFLAGVAAGLVGERERARGTEAAEVRRRAVRRALEVLLYAALFRAWMFASGLFWRPADLLRVDVLNCIGVSLLLLVPPLAARSAALRLGGVLALGVAIAALTPLAWDASAVSALPWPLRGYLSGRDPDALFPIFPWSAFTAAGAAAGVVLSRARAHAREGVAVAMGAATGAAAIAIALYADRHFPAVYPVYDFWYTSPAYVAIRAGVALIALSAAYLLDRIPGPSALRQLGRTSLFVYWVHIEVVYGRWILAGARGRLSIESATWGVAALMLAMLALSIVRTHARGWWNARPARQEAAA